MRNFQDISDTADAIREFMILNRGKLDQHLLDKIGDTGMGQSPVDLAQRFVETAYANRDLMPEEGLDIAAGAAEQFAMRGFYGRLNDRAPAMALALRRDAGTKAAAGHPWPKKDKDPAVDPAFVKPQEPANGSDAG